MRGGVGQPGLARAPIQPPPPAGYLSNILAEGRAGMPWVDSPSSREGSPPQKATAYAPPEGPIGTLTPPLRHSAPLSIWGVLHGR